MQLLRLHPYLQVTSLEEAKTFYSKLGFDVEWTYDDKHPTHMMMDAHEVSIGFVLVSQDQKISRADLYIEVEGVKNLHAKYAETLEEVSGLIQSDYGMLDFSITDPWGHHLVFGEYISDEEPIDLQPNISDQAYVFITLSDRDADPDMKPIMIYEEQEGTSMIITKEQALQFKFPTDDLWAKVSLGFESDLSMVGLTATISEALKKVGMPCNVVAAYFHDHIFVPFDRRVEAYEVLSKITFRF